MREGEEGEVGEWKETGKRRNGYCDINVNMCFLFRNATGLHLINARCIEVRSLKPHQELTDTVFYDIQVFNYCHVSSFRHNNN